MAQFGYQIARIRKFSFLRLSLGLGALVVNMFYLLSAKGGQTNGGVVPPTKLALPGEKDEIAPGFTCSAFELNSDEEAASKCDQLARALIAGQWDGARQLAGELMNRYPRNGIGYFSLGYVELKEGKYISAVGHFQKAVDRSPEVVAAHLNLGLSYAVVQQYKLFEDEMRWIMVNFPQDPLPYYYLGRYYSKELELLEKGAELFQQALSRDSNDYKSRYHLGYLFELKGELAKAKAEYEIAAAAAAAQRAPYGWPLQGLARLYLQKQDLAEALRYARVAVSRDSKLASSRLLLGKLYVQTGEVENGIRELKGAAELDPTDATPHYLLSRAYQKMNLPAEAQREQETFIQLKAVYPNE